MERARSNGRQISRAAGIAAVVAVILVSAACPAQATDGTCYTVGVEHPPYDPAVEVCPPDLPPTGRQTG